MGHVAALDLVLVNQTIPMVVELVLLFGLSRYAGVPVSYGTNNVH
jgi:hypothetical protein